MYKKISMILRIRFIIVGVLNNYLSYVDKSYNKQHNNKNSMLYLCMYKFT